MITDPALPVNVTIGAGAVAPSLNVSALITAGTGVLPAMTISLPLLGGAMVNIPASTTITSTDPAWDGILGAPTSTTVDLPVTSGQTKTLGIALELGDTGSSLTFDKAVRIFFPGQAGKRIGYTRSGQAFTEIVTACTNDTQTTNNTLPASGDCKIDV